MNQENSIRMNWLKGMYIYTIVGAGGFGLGMVFMPELVKALLGWPVNEPLIFGMVGSVYLAFATLSILGLKAPLKFAPILLLQLIYKSIWLVVLALPALTNGDITLHAALLTIIFLSYIIGDIIAIPFSQIFSAQKAG